MWQAFNDAARDGHLGKASHKSQDQEVRNFLCVCLCV